MPVFVQAKATQGFKAKENEGTLKETKFPLHAQKVAPPVGESHAPNWGLSFQAPFDTI